MGKADPLDLRRLKTYPIARRKNLVDSGDFGYLANPRSAVDLINSLPDIYAGRDRKSVV